MSTNWKRVVGIDLGGARMRTTGVVVLEGAATPAISEAGILARAPTAEAAERQLLEFIERVRPTTVAIDAPLTLPPACRVRVSAGAHRRSCAS
jgi:predicted nuclease with RNAse H fold